MLRTIVLLFVFHSPCMISAQDNSHKDSDSEQIQITVTEQMVAAADALLSTMTGEPTNQEKLLGYSRKEELSLPFGHEAKRDWAYWPKDRVGLILQKMTAVQRGLVHDLLSSVLSAKGYLKVIHIMQLEEVLDALDTSGVPRGLEDYILTFFGPPSKRVPWSWRFEGHHISLNISVMPEAIVVTPSFLGANPAEIQSGPLAGFRALRFEEEYGRQLVLSLDAQQRAKAVLSGAPPSDVLSGSLLNNNSDEDSWKEILQPDGIPVMGLSQDQKVLAKRILEEVVTNYRPEISIEYLRMIDLDDLNFAWLGSLRPGEPHYYRLQGSDFVFEFDNAVGHGSSPDQGLVALDHETDAHDPHATGHRRDDQFVAHFRLGALDAGHGWNAGAIDVRVHQADRRPQAS